MGLSGEFEHSIREQEAMGNTNGVNALNGLRNVYASLVVAGVVKELSGETELASMGETSVRSPKRHLSEISGELVRTARLGLHLRQGDVAAGIGRSQTFISAIENGRTTRINSETATKLYSALGIATTTSQPQKPRTA
jgi:ribosome-binding protein aMBF1 (putative translation factor)